MTAHTPETPAVAPIEPSSPPPGAAAAANPLLPPRRAKTIDLDLERELDAAMAGFDSTDFMSSLAGKKPGPRTEPSPTKKGKVFRVHGDDVFVDMGGRSQGILSLAQFPEGVPEVGADVEVSFEGYDSANGLQILRRVGTSVAEKVDWSSVAEGMVVEARVTATNKGGLEVEVNGIRGFLPISQIELFRIEDVSPFVGQKVLCQVTEVNPAERNLVVSRRALLEKQREETRAKLWAELAEGQQRTGIVRNVRDFGAFIDLGGVDGLLPVGEMSWQRVAKAEDVVRPGDKVDVVVIKIDRETRKLTLSLKRLQASPWDDVETKFGVGLVVPGKVTRLADFGAFVELAPGLEGLVHISELAKNRVFRVSDVVKVGQDVAVRVLAIDREQRRISLTIKGAVEEPPPPSEEEVAAKDDAAPEAPAKKPPTRKTGLKGGIGGGGPLFKLPSS
jgi:small subunit ribosomal protein S1